MKNKIIFLVLIVFNLTHIDSQFYQEWVSRYNGTGNNNDEALSIAVDISGNVYVTGYTVVAALNEDYATVKYNAQGVVQWVQTYNGLGTSVSYDDAYSIVVDASGNVYVTGFSRGNGTGYDIATIKYNSNGVLQWIQRYNGSDNGDDGAYFIAVDNSGNVYVTGESKGVSHNLDYCTIKYNSSGVQEWIALYNGTGNSDDIAYSLALDGSGNVYITGVAGGSGTNSDYCTVKYNSSGIQQWVQYYNGQPGYNVDIPHAIAVDDSGYVYVTGQSRNTSETDHDYATIKYNSNGVQQWVKRYNGTGFGMDIAWGIAVDALGNVYVTGESVGSGTSSDYSTVKYNLSGTQLWVARYNSSVNDVDIANAITLDSSGNIYVTGQSSGSGTNRDYATIKYNSSGVQQWAARYNGPASNVDNAKVIKIGAFGNVYITVLSRGSSTLEDYATIKYIQVPYSPSNLNALAVSSSKINLDWIDNSGNETGFKIERSTNAGANWSLINIVGVNVTSYSDTGLVANTIFHYRVYASNQAGNSGYSNIAFDTTFTPVGIINKNELPSEYKLFQNYPNPFNPVTNIRFDIISKSNVKLIVYDILGREVALIINQKLQAGSYKVDWEGTNYPSGIYFYKLETDTYNETKRMVLIK
jgi:uncharacterized delta-60 repeat protein